MTFMDLCQRLQDLPLSVAIVEGYLFAVIETVHVIALVLVFGSIAVVDLRLLGISSRGHSVHQLSKDVLPVTWIAFGFAVMSGSLLFISKATTYAADWPFRFKFCFMVLAGLNMLIFQFITSRSVSEWDLASPAPRTARLAGGLSLLFWIGVIACGRWVGFTV